MLLADSERLTAGTMLVCRRFRTRFSAWIVGVFGVGDYGFLHTVNRSYCNVAVRIVLHEITCGGCVSQCRVLFPSGGKRIGAALCRRETRCSYGVRPAGQACCINLTSGCQGNRTGYGRAGQLDLMALIPPCIHLDRTYPAGFQLNRRISGEGHRIDSCAVHKESAGAAGTCR